MSILRYSLAALTDHIQLTFNCYGHAMVQVIGWKPLKC